MDKTDSFLILWIDLSSFMQWLTHNLWFLDKITVKVVFNSNNNLQINIIGSPNTIDDMH